jgi:glucose dehydrogenase
VPRCCASWDQARQWPRKAQRREVTQRNRKLSRLWFHRTARSDIALPATWSFDPDGYPAVQPPWGTLSAIDLNTGKYLWKISLGNYPELAPKGMADAGTENYGGPLVTAGGLVIIGATNFDRAIRAFDSTTGKLLWSAELPYDGNATPATYMIDGKQYIVIAASSARNAKGPQGAAYAAFALE